MTDVLVRARAQQSPLNLVRGFLIGLAELMPGISGGTIALVTGVYERALDSASALGGALLALVKGPDRRAGFAARMREVEWWLVVPAVVGMLVAVLFASGPVVALVEAFPVESRGLFLGLVAVSIAVPYQMAPKRRAGVPIIGEVLLVVVPAIIAFWAVGFAGGSDQEDPAWWIIVIAAAFAVCALVVPGLSGSFLLLALGLYAPTLNAVHDRDLGYIGTFAIGALIGLTVIVSILRVLLRRVRRGTLLVMVGLMIGSLRALWPWQTADGGLAAPTDPFLPILLAVVGAAVVIGLMGAEKAIARRAS
ncbi:DUF368 domain-containing protein [Microbacterium indicum]|uniref:DUF368 domain-containing protein n=1 Tax=Microbacterium indicum TaxID=358100 RepID=UPI0003F6B54D|nr:DUF368 domain-containing protein [Microbacterium indicum]